MGSAACSPARLRPPDLSRPHSRSRSGTARAHGLRATYITLARAGGAELEAIADDVGHADIRMTRRYLDRSRRKANNSALRIPVDFTVRTST